MTQDHRLQQQRFELKYLVPESLTSCIRDFVSSHLELDEFGISRPGRAYPVHSIYLDSEDLQTHHAYISGTKNRYKLRLRYYDDKPDSPVFFEIKGRVDNCIRKSRCGVRREVVRDVLAGQLPSRAGFITREPRHFEALERFILLMQSINARPKAHNHYLREAWVSAHDNSVRVTFDRQIQIEPYFKDEPDTAMRSPVFVYSPVVVMELKFTTRFPNWFTGMVERFNLMQGSSAKYCGGVMLLGEHRFKERTPFEPDTLATALPAICAVDMILAEV